MSCAQLMGCMDAHQVQHMTWSGEAWTGWLSRTQRDDVDHAVTALRTQLSSLSIAGVTLETRDCATVSVIGPTVSELRGLLPEVTAALKTAEIPLLRMEQESETIRIYVASQHEHGATRELHKHLSVGP